MKTGNAHDPLIRQFVASDGYRFHYRHWETTSDNPVGYVVALHGIQSHSAWYKYSSGRLCDAGYEVCFLDRRGSGLNESVRGHTPHADRLVNDVVQFLADIRHRRNHEAPKSPVILMGVSWGGKLAAVTTARRPELVDALALLYPGICARIRPGWFQKLQLRLAGVLGMWQNPIPIPLDDPKLFTSDSDWQQFIRDDPLALHLASVSLLIASLELDRLAEQAREQIHCPLLLMLAGRDRIIDNLATRRYFDRIRSANRRLIEYPEAAHTLEFEPNREQFVCDLLEWLNTIKTIAESGSFAKMRR